MLVAGTVAALVAFGGRPARAAELTSQEAATALRRAVAFFREHVSAQGGYVWRYSSDLTLHEGEGRASATTAWVQPPGTPTVGNALLDVFLLTGDRECLDAARAAAYSLVAGQLESGGWDYRIEYAPEARQKYRYRIDDDRPQARNTTTLDDNTTQAALRILMRVDQTLAFQDAEIHGAVQYALDRLLAAQYPNGAWPQRFDQPPDPAAHPVRKARFPESWPRDHPQVDYRGYYTFNDNTIADMIETMLDAAAIYDEPQYRQAAIRAGDFILLAQLPDPQPAWAQQYNAAMEPAWARKFEPPSVTGGESQGVLRTLLMLYRETGEDKFLAPVPKALDYLQSSTRPDGKLARFYELRTNRPLYFTREYKLTYEDDDLPTHYGFVVGSGLERLRADYLRLLETGPSRDAAASRRNQRPSRPRPTAALTSRARAAVDALDDRGAWIESGDLRAFDRQDVEIIDSRTFARNIVVLAEFLAAQRQP